MLQGCVELPDGLPCWLYWGCVKSSKANRSWFDPVIYPKKPKQSVFICEDSQINNILYHFMCFVLCFVLFFFRDVWLTFPNISTKTGVRRLTGDPRLPLRELSALCDQLVQAGVEPRHWAIKKAIGWGKLSINNLDFTDLPSGYLTVRHGKIHHF